MTRDAPDLARFSALAGAAFAELPESFRALCGIVVIHVAEVADADILASFGIDDPLELSGLYEGVHLIDASIMDPAPEPSHVHLYRRAILAEWREHGDISLEQLVRHVLVHEIGHHFGLSDEDMHAIEEMSD